MDMRLSQKLPRAWNLWAQQHSTNSGFPVDLEISLQYMTHNKWNKKKHKHTVQSPLPSLATPGDPWWPLTLEQGCDEGSGHACGAHQHGVTHLELSLGDPAQHHGRHGRQEAHHRRLHLMGARKRRRRMKQGNVYDLCNSRTPILQSCQSFNLLRESSCPTRRTRHPSLIPVQVLWTLIMFLSQQ